jgi:hypothetical protein
MAANAYYSVIMYMAKSLVFPTGAEDGNDEIWYWNMHMLESLVLQQVQCLSVGTHVDNNTYIFGIKMNCKVRH